MPRSVTFPAVDAGWNAVRATAFLYAVDDGVVVNCLVPIETLMTYFGVEGPQKDECLRAVGRHRPVIEDAARRKILAGPTASKHGAKLVLLPDDLPRQTTTTQPPRFGGLVPHLDSAVASDPGLRRGVDAANAVLDWEIVRGRAQARADWNAVPGPSGLTLVRLTLTDADTGAAAEGLFTRADLEDAPSARTALARIWDDMLSEKFRVLSLALETADEAGV